MAQQVGINETVLNPPADSYAAPTLEEMVCSSNFIQKAQVILDGMFEMEAQYSERIRELQASIEAHKSFLSPVRRFPSEILIHIFTFTLERNPICLGWDTESTWWKGDRFIDTDPSVQVEYVYKHSARFDGDQRDRHYIFGHPRRSPWSISAVCRRWRDIAIETPVLWTHIQLLYHPFVYPPPDASISAAVARLKLAFRRSEPLGVDVSIISRNYSSYNGATEFISSQQHRWETYAVQSSVRMRIYHTLLPLPRLKSVVASHPGAYPFGGSADYINAKQFRTWYCVNKEPVYFRIAGFTQIHHVSSCIVFAHAGHPTLSAQLHTLSSLPNLQTLRCLVYISLLHHARQSLEIDFPKLVSLTLGSPLHSERTVHEVLMMMSTPSLERLQIVSLQSTQPLVSLIKRSHCSLTSIHLSEVASTSIELHDLLDVTPLLRVFYVNFSIHYLHLEPNIGCIHNSLLSRLFDGYDTVRSKLPHLYSISLLSAVEMNINLIVDLLCANDTLARRLSAITLGLRGLDLDLRREDILLLKRRGCTIKLKNWEAIPNGSDIDSCFGTESEAESTNSDTSNSWVTSESLDSSDTSGSQALLTTARLLDLDDSDGSDLSSDY